MTKIGFHRASSHAVLEQLGEAAPGAPRRVHLDAALARAARARRSRGVCTETSSPTASLASSAIVRRGHGAAKENGRPW